jgi:uncharacterized membrane protein
MGSKNYLNSHKKGMSTKKMVLGAILTALVIVLQALATFTTFFGPFSTALALIPIVIVAALCGPAVAAWLGFVFGAVVIFTGGADAFLSFSIIGTILTVLGKGTACGFVAGIVNKLLKKVSKTLAVFVAALVCPIVNTGVFLLGSAIFFLPYAEPIATKFGMDDKGFGLFVALAFGNFIFEIGMSAVLCPAIHRIVNLKNRIK